MKNWNRILSALLAALMFCAMLPAGVLAETDVVLEGEDLEIVLDDAATGEDTLELDILEAPDELDLNDLTLDDLTATDVATEDAVNAPEGNASNPEDFIIKKGVLIEYIGPGGSVTIPDDVVSIGKNAFENCDSVTYVTFPEGVKMIGPEAFKDCDGLSHVVIPNGVTTIGNGAFELCSNLSRIDLPYSVKRINSRVFYGCYSLNSMNTWGNIYIPSSITYIDSSAFEGCTRIQRVNIPRSVTAIGKCVFFNCENLEYIKLSSSVKKIGGGTFYGCSSLKNITILASKIDIDQYCEKDDYYMTFGDTPNLVVYAWEGSDVYNLLLYDFGLNVKKIADNIIPLKGSTTKKVQLGDKIYIMLDGEKSESFSSSNNKIAAVSSDGAVSLKKTGTVKITAKMISGSKWVLTLNVVAAPKLSKSTLSLKVGRSAKLNVNGLLAGRTVAWSSSNNSIATVSNGKITAKKPGKCTIYAQVKNGVKLKCTVKVTR